MQIKIPAKHERKSLVRKYGLKILFYFIGTVISTCGLSILTTNALGSNAMNTLFTAVAWKLDFPVGTIYTIFNGTFVLIGFLIARRYMGIASLLMLVLQGPFLNLWLGFFGEHPEWFTGFWPKALMAVLGLLFSTMGSGLSTSTRLGTAGFEASLFTLADKIKIEYKYLKMTSELVYFAAAMFLGGVYGIMTIVEILGWGPLVSLFIINIDRTLFKWLKISDVRNELYRNNRRWIRKQQMLESQRQRADEQME